MLFRSGRFLDGVGSLVRVPGSVFTTITDFAKAVHVGAEMDAQAWRLATNKGLKGEEFSNFVSKYSVEQQTNPDVWQDPDYVTIWERAQQAAKERTFTADSGKIGKAITGLANTVPLGRVVLPFLKVPMNLVKFGFERTPLIGMLSKEMQGEIAAGGARRDLALAKQAMGVMIYGTAATLAASGHLTGYGPLDPNLRKQKSDEGWLPNSAHVGDKFYQLSGLEPYGMMLGWAADIHEMSGQIPADHPLQERIAEYALAATLATSREVVSRTWMKGLSDTLDALTSNRGDTWVQHANTLAQQYAKSVVPRVVAQTARAQDPYQLEVRSIGDAIRSEIPGMSKDVPAHRDLFGEPHFLEGGLGPDTISPVYESTWKHDPVREEIISQDMSIPESSYHPGFIGPRVPKDEVFLGAGPNEKVPLTPKEKDRLAVLIGREVTIDGMNLHESLADLMASSDYKEAVGGRGGVKEALVKQRISEFRKEGEAALQDEEDRTGGDIAQRLESAYGRREQRLEPQPQGSARGGLSIQ